jgi:hypothetical protein
MRFLSGEQTWTMQSRPNSGGDTFHDVMLGIAAYGRMAAVLGDAGAFGSAAYLFAKNLAAYFNFEKASLDWARAHPPWLVPLTPQPMVTWDNYMDFGPFFTPLSQLGAYGGYSGFYEHYLRMGEGKYGVADILPRFYRELLPGHARAMFGETMAREVPPKCFHPNPERNFYCYQQPLDDLRAFIRSRILGQRVALEDGGEPKPTLLRLGIEEDVEPRRADIVPAALAAAAGEWQEGVDRDGIGIGHGLLLAHAGDGDFAGLPMLSWFGLSAAGKRLRLHDGNLMSFGVFGPELRRGAYVARETRPSWTTRSIRFEEVAGPLPSATP